MEAQEQAKQLDSVTDRVQEKEVDATKAQQAMSALSFASAKHTAEQVAVSREDVALIVAELEITDEAAERALRQVATETRRDGESLVVAALRKLVTS